jgi:hypothetical protein
MNIQSYFYRGTIEFRHHHGSTNLWEISTWARLWLEVVELASRIPERLIVSRFKNHRDISILKARLYELLSPALVTELEARHKMYTTHSETLPDFGVSFTNDIEYERNF